MLCYSWRSKPLERQYIEIPPGATWARVRGCLVDKVILPAFLAPAKRARDGNLRASKKRGRDEDRPIPRWETLSTSLHEVEAVRGEPPHDNATLQALLGLERLHDADPVGDNDFLLLFRSPASKGLLLYAQQAYYKEFPRPDATSRGVPAEPETPVQVKQDALDAMTPEEQCAYLVQEAKRNWDAEGYGLSTRPQYTLAQSDAYATRQSMCTVTQEPVRRRATGIPQCQLREPRTDAERATAMINADGGLVVQRSPRLDKNLQRSKRTRR